MQQAHIPDELMSLLNILIIVMQALTSHRVISGHILYISSFHIIGTTIYGKTLSVHKACETI